MPAPSARTVIDLYQSQAATWEDRRSQTLFEAPWLDAFRAAMPAGNSTVLDLGCGTGRPMAAHLIAQGCRITGIDGAPGMIERAREYFPDHRWIAADMRALPPLGRFAGILAWHSSFHLPQADQRALLQSLPRLAAPGAALMFTSGSDNGESIGTMAGQPLYHASLAPKDYRTLLKAQNFEILRHITTDPTCGGATVWLARHHP